MPSLEPYIQQTYTWRLRNQRCYFAMECPRNIKPQCDWLGYVTVKHKLSCPYVIEHTFTSSISQLFARVGLFALFFSSAYWLKKSGMHWNMLEKKNISARLHMNVKIQWSSKDSCFILLQLWYVYFYVPRLRAQRTALSYHNTLWSLLQNSQQQVTSGFYCCELAQEGRHSLTNLPARQHKSFILIHWKFHEINYYFNQAMNTLHYLFVPLADTYESFF